MPRDDILHVGLITIGAVIAIILIFTIPASAAAQFDAIWTTTRSGDITTTACDQYGTRFFIGTSLGNVTGLDATGAVLWYYDNTYAVSKLLTDQSGDHVWLYDTNNTLKRLNGATGAEEWKNVTDITNFGGITDIAVANGGTFVVATGFDVLVWNATHDFIGYRSVNTSGTHNKLAIANDGSWFVVSHTDTSPHGSWPYLYHLNTTHETPPEFDLNSSLAGSWAYLSDAGTPYTMVHFDTRINTVSGDPAYTIQQITAPKSGSWIGVSGTLRTYMQEVQQNSGGWKYPATTGIASTSGTCNKNAISNNANFLIEGRNSYVYIYSIAGELSGSYQAGGTINTVGIATTGLYAAAGGDDGVLYVFSKEGTSNWVLQYASTTGNPVSSLAMTWTGDTVIASRMGGSATLYRLTTATSTSQPYFPPHTVEIQVVDGWGTPITDADVTIYGVNQSVSDSWLSSLFGTDFSQVEIQNTKMTAPTDRNGNAVFTAVQSVQYRVVVTRGGTELMNTSMYMNGDQYQLWTVNWNPFAWFQNTANPLQEVNVTITTDIVNASHGSITVHYLDNMSQTNGGIINLNTTNKTGANLPQIQLESVPIAASDTTAVFIVPRAVNKGEGASYFIHVNATHDTFSVVKRTFIAQFSPPPINAGIPDGWQIYIAVFCVLMTGCIFGATTGPGPGALFASFMGWIFFAMGWWWSVGTIAAGTALTFATVISVASIMMMRSRKDRWV